MSSIIENLHAMRSQIDSLIAAASADSSIGTMPVQKAKKTEKKERANKGQATLHGAWTKHVMALHDTKSAEYALYLEDRLAQARAGKLLYNETYTLVKRGKKSAGDPMTEDDAKRGAHIAFVSHWKSAHPDEHAAFKSKWETENPKAERVASSKSSAASVSDEESDGTAKQPKKRGAKKYADMTPEELAAAKAKRAAKKDAKDATKKTAEAEQRQESVMEAADSPAASVAEEAEQPAEEDGDDTFMPFTHKKINYLRYGSMDDEGEPLWHEDGDLWLANADGSKGAYAGVLKSTGKIDNSPAVMANEPVV